ncbi:MAG: four helix bundle protein [Paludibacteraceae bacterium]|jgi:four helix bundle protein|nr:four helix bundle protein [Paludibacteraceae bacterium]
MFNFEKLNAYQNARLLVKDVYNLLDKFPQKEEFALKSQLRRAVVSIPSNIAEGMGRISDKEKIHFIEIAYSSLMEVYCQLQLANDLNYITNSDFDQIKPLIEDNAKLLSGLRKNFIPKQ